MSLSIYLFLLCVYVFVISSKSTDQIHVICVRPFSEFNTLLHKPHSKPPGVLRLNKPSCIIAKKASSIKLTHWVWHNQPMKQEKGKVGKIWKKGGIGLR